MKEQNYFNHDLALRETLRAKLLLANISSEPEPIVETIMETLKQAGWGKA